MARAIVIGSGIAGLASAIRLAVKGYKVEVFEANDYPGGKLSEIRHDGFRFDAGPSLFTMAQEVDALFRLAGRDPSKHFSYQRLEEVCRYFYEDGTRFTASADPDEFAKEAADTFGVDAAVVRKHLRRSSYIYRTTAHLFLQRSLHKVSSYLRLPTAWSFLQLPFLHILSTMNGLNRRKLGEARLVQLFNRYATYNGSNPYRAPGILHIIPHLEYMLGAYYPRGGMYSITTSLVELAESLGVVFHYGSPVSRIRVADGKVTGIEAGDATHEAGLVVCNMDILPAYRELLKDQRQPERILSQERSSSALIFYWGISKSFPELGLHNILFSADYEAEFDAIFGQGTTSDDPTVYINITSKEEPSDAPEGMENWFVMINVPSDSGQDWDELIPLARERILSKLSRHLGCDVASLITTEDVLEPRTIESKTRSFGGALYGTSSNSRMAAFFRHPNFSTRIGGLYFCGGSVHPGGGIPLALASASIVDSMIKPSRA